MLDLRARLPLKVLMIALLTTAAAPANLHAAQVVPHAAASSGCGTVRSPGDTLEIFASGGQIRDAILHLPSGYTASQPLPLVLNLHAYTSNAISQLIVSGMNATADRQDFIVAYPDGTPGSNGVTGWNINIPGTPPSTDLPAGIVGVTWTANDKGFLTDLVNRIESEACVDTSRITVTGFSMGGIMSFALACSGTGWLAAIAPVASSPPWGTNAAACPWSHRVSIEAFHGEQDAVDIFAGNGGAASLPTMLGSVSPAQGCAATGMQIWQSGDVVETGYAPCTSTAEIDLYRVTDGGHEWPGGMDLWWLGTNTHVINASDLIGTFASTHALQPLTRHRFTTKLRVWKPISSIRRPLRAASAPLVCWRGCAWPASSRKSTAFRRSASAVTN